MPGERPPRPATPFPGQQAGIGADSEQNGSQRHPEHWLLSAQDGTGRVLSASGSAAAAPDGVSLQMCSNNLNQYAKVANENGQIYTADLEDLRARLDELISVSKQILAKLTEL